MSKTLMNAKNFLNKATQSEQKFKEGFEVSSPIKSQTIGISVSVNLTKEEERLIQKILVDDYKPGILSENDVSEHIKQISDITRQIKSISAQSVLLHGERIKKAQEILSNYRDGCFTKWLLMTYGNRQTPYSMLRYYELYQNVPQNYKIMIEAVPKKAVYMLASRDGDINKKLEIIEKHGKDTQSDLLLLIQETFPVSQTNNRKSVITSTIESLEKACKKLEVRKQYLVENDVCKIENIISQLVKIKSRYA